MRRLFAIGAVVSLAGTTAPQAWQTVQPSVWVTITPEDGSAKGSVELTETTLSIGFPSVGVATEAPRPGFPSERQFGIRAWKEGDQARVVVYAMLTDKRSPEGWTATPIATFLLAPGKGIVVKEPIKWGGTPVVVGSEVRVR